VTVLWLLSFSGSKRKQHAGKKEGAVEFINREQK
jgi:hypothetical protein